MVIMANGLYGLVKTFSSLAQLLPYHAACVLNSISSHNVLSFPSMILVYQLLPILAFLDFRTSGSHVAVFNIKLPEQPAALSEPLCAATPLLLLVIFHTMSPYAILP